MKNSDVFTSSGYDMVVSVTQKSVNDQLIHLAHPDIATIKTRYKLRILQAYIYEVVLTIRFPKLYSEHGI